MTSRCYVCTGRRNWADSGIYRQILSDFAIVTLFGLDIVGEGSNRGRERKSTRKEWMALHLEDWVKE